MTFWTSKKKKTRLIVLKIYHKGDSKKTEKKAFFFSHNRIQTRGI